MRAPSARPIALVALGVTLLLVGSFWGLAKAPGEVFMGDVQRIMYVHVPTAWNAMLALTFAFGGILALRAFADDPAKRAVWSSVACIVAFVDVPIVYFSVKWWNSLHQAQSTPQTVSSAFHWPLRINAFGILFLWIGLVGLRTRVAALRRRGEMAPPLPENRPAPGRAQVTGGTV